MLDNKIGNISIKRIVLFYIIIEVLQFHDIKWSFDVYVWRGQ